MVKNQCVSCSSSSSREDNAAMSVSCSSTISSEAVLTTTTCSSSIGTPLISSRESVVGSADSLTLRPLRTSDRLAVEALCNKSFPIQYPTFWYDEVVSGQLTSTGLFDGDRLAAMIVSETKRVADCNVEDQDILGEMNSQVVYILSLAVAVPYRRMGLATKLLDNLFEMVVDKPPYPRAVFLHVLSTNLAALSFYKRHEFQWHASLANYYRIGNEYGDGFTYVKYTNGSRPPMSLYQLCRSLGSTICLPIKAICRIFSY